MFDENTLPYVSPNQSQTNIDVSPHLATFVESFSNLQTPDNYNLREVQVASPPITSDNAATPHVLIDDKGIIDLSSTISDFEEQVEFDDPYIHIETPAANFEYASNSEEQVALKGPTNDHHQTTTLVYVPVDLKLDNATLQSTIFDNV